MARRHRNKPKGGNAAQSSAGGQPGGNGPDGSAVPPDGSSNSKGDPASDSIRDAIATLGAYVEPSGDTFAQNIVREAVVYQLAKEADKQFWDRIHRPFRRGIAIIVIMLGLIGVTGFTFIPSWIQSITETQVKESIKEAISSFEKEARIHEEKTLNALADQRVSARDLEADQERLIGVLDKQSQSLQVDFKKRQSSIEQTLTENETLTADLKKKAEQTREQFDAINKVVNVDVAKELASKVDSIEKLTVSNDAKQLIAQVSALRNQEKELGKLNDRVDRLSNVRSGPFLTGRMSLDEFKRRARPLEELFNRDQYGDFQQVFELRIRFNGGFNNPIVISDVQSRVLQGGGQFSGTIAAYVMSVEETEFVLRVVTRNLDQIKDATICWIATEAQEFE